MFNVLVGVVIFDANGKVLLVEEKKEQNKGLLNLPMGHLERNESLIEGAKREVLEETGYNVDLKTLVYSKSFEHNNNCYISFIFKGCVCGCKTTESELQNSFYDTSFIKNNPDKLRNAKLILSAIDCAQKERPLLEILG